LVRIWVFGFGVTQKEMCMAELTPARLMPYLTLTELPLPDRLWRVWGSGPLFVERMRLAQHAGRVALVMQGSQGELAMTPGDVVALASVRSIDWLSEPQIRIELDVNDWGLVAAEVGVAYPSQLSVHKRGRWLSQKSLFDDDPLVAKLGDLVSQRPDWSLTPASRAERHDPVWICLRWLELLPLPLRIKQRLLQAPSSKLALRYLNKMVRQSDRFATPLR
jgi:hypothetical protein